MDWKLGRHECSWYFIIRPPTKTCTHKNTHERIKRRTQTRAQTRAHWHTLQLESYEWIQSFLPSSLPHSAPLYYCLGASQHKLLIAIFITCAHAYVIHTYIHACMHTYLLTYLPACMNTYTWLIYKCMPIKPCNTLTTLLHNNYATQANIVYGTMIVNSFWGSGVNERSSWVNR